MKNIKKEFEYYVERCILYNLKPQDYCNLKTYIKLKEDNKLSEKRD